MVGSGGSYNFQRDVYHNMGGGEGGGILFSWKTLQTPSPPMKEKFGKNNVSICPKNTEDKILKNLKMKV